MASRRRTARTGYPQRRQGRKHRTTESSLTDVLHKLVDQSESPAEFLEVYYWSQERTWRR